MKLSLNILLADDNDELRDATRELLEEQGHTVTVAARGDDALRLAPQITPPIDVLVSDVLMPGLTGVELADRLIATNPDLPVVLISSRSDDSSLIRRLQAGDVAFVSKPFAADELLAKVELSHTLTAQRSQSAGPFKNEGRPHREDVGYDDTLAKLMNSMGPRVETRPSNLALSRRRGRLQMAAVVALALGAGLVWRSLEPGPPPLAPPVAETVTRSAIIGSTSPRGPIPETPALLSWKPVGDAVSYRVDLRQIDNTVLWQSEVDRPEVELPQSVAEALDRSVIYTWNVNAFDSAQKRLATSGPVLFSIDLATESTEHPSSGE